MGDHGQCHTGIWTAAVLNAFHHRCLDAAEYAVGTDDHLPLIGFSSVDAHHTGIGVCGSYPFIIDEFSADGNRRFQPEMIVARAIDKIKGILLPVAAQQAIAIVQAVFSGFMEEDAPATEVLGGNIEYFFQYPDGLPGDESATDFRAGKSCFVEDENIESFPGEYIRCCSPGRTSSDDQNIDCVGIRHSRPRKLSHATGVSIFHVMADNNYPLHQTEASIDKTLRGEAVVRVPRTSNNAGYGNLRLACKVKLFQLLTEKISCHG